MSEHEAIEGTDLLAVVVDSHPMSGEILLRLVDPSEACFLPPVGEVTMLATPVSQEPDTPRIVVAH